MVELGPFLRRVERRVAKNPDSPAWAAMEARWRALVDHARGMTDQVSPGSRHERSGAQELLKVAETVPDRNVVHAILAMFLLQDHDPHRFRSDAAFRMQLTRRVRALTDINVGTFWDHREGRMKRVYRDLPVRTAMVLGTWLATALGGAGGHLAKLEREDEQRAQEDRNSYHEALVGLR